MAQASRSGARVIEVEGWTAVCFAAPVVELTDERTAAAKVAHLGPDLTRAGITDEDIDAAARGRGQLPDPHEEIGNVMLDQRLPVWRGQRLQERVFVRLRREPVHAC